MNIGASCGLSPNAGEVYVHAPYLAVSKDGYRDAPMIFLNLKTNMHCYHPVAAVNLLASRRPNCDS